MKKLFGIGILIFLLPLISCNNEDDDVFGRYTGTQVFGAAQTQSPVTFEFNGGLGTNLTGAITPPGSTTLVPILVLDYLGTSTRFSRREGDITYIYQVALANNQATGVFEPLGCINPATGEECPADSEGSFTASK